MPLRSEPSHLAFVTQHPGHVLITGLLVIYAVFRQKLTTPGVIVAIATALVHMLHPSSLPLSMLISFFGVGMIGTRVSRERKATLTMSAAGGSGGEGPRNASQVLANSGAASAVLLLHFFAPQVLAARTALTGVAANYAAAGADTLSSELGILSSSPPFLITQPWKRVPKGTNGGVTLAGLAAGLIGAATAATLMMGLHADVGWTYLASLTALGLAGSVLDSLLGALCQATVEDKESGRVIEGPNGRRVLLSQGGSRVQRGRDLLNNNGVNFAMTLTIAVVGMLIMPSR